MRRQLPTMIAVLLLVATVAGSGVASASGQDMAAVRAATAQYHRVDAAQAAGYQPFLDCMEMPGVGGMGFHYVNFNIVDLTIDPLAPEAMVYAPGPQGQLQLGAVEYLVPIAAWDAHHSSPPTLFGQTYERNDTLGVYTLHAWVWKNNKLGMFQDWNPAVSCRS